MRMSLSKRAELIVALNEKDREIIYKTMGENAKLRELIDSEVESIQVDPAKKRGVEMRQAEIWKNFVDLIRDAIQTNPMYLDNAQTVLKSWVEERKGNTAVSSSASAA